MANGRGPYTPRPQPSLCDSLGPIAPCRVAERVRHTSRKRAPALTGCYELLKVAHSNP